MRREELESAKIQIARLESILRIACQIIPYHSGFTNALMSYDRDYGVRAASPPVAGTPAKEK